MESGSLAPQPRQQVPAAGVLAFVLEVSMLGAAGLWAIDVLPVHPVAAVLVVAVPLVVFWGLFMAPQAARRIGWPLHPVIAHVLFLLGVVLLYSSGHPFLGTFMAVLAATSALLVWRDRVPAAQEARSQAEAVRSRREARRPGGRRAAR